MSWWHQHLTIWEVYNFLWWEQREINQTSLSLTRCFQKYPPCLYVRHSSLSRVSIDLAATKSVVNVFFSPLLHQDGIISVKDIDLVMSEGLGMRYAFIGPMETMHLNAPEGKALFWTQAIEWPQGALWLAGLQTWHGAAYIHALYRSVAFHRESQRVRVKPQGDGEYQRGVWNLESNPDCVHTHKKGRFGRTKPSFDG